MRTIAKTWPEVRFSANPHPERSGGFDPEFFVLPKANSRGVELLCFGRA